MWSFEHINRTWENFVVEGLRIVSVWLTARSGGVALTVTKTRIATGRAEIGQVLSQTCSPVRRIIETNRKRWLRQNMLMDL
jgi:hypothetical protein